MTDNRLTEMARSVLAAFLLSLGITPSEGKDTLEIRDFGPHRVWTQQARVPDSMADSIDRDDVLSRLIDYMEHRNALPAAVKFQPYNVEAYICPCGCGTFLYVSICHTA